MVHIKNINVLKCSVHDRTKARKKKAISSRLGEIPRGKLSELDLFPGIHFFNESNEINSNLFIELDQNDRTEIGIIAI